MQAIHAKAHARLRCESLPSFLSIPHASTDVVVFLASEIVEFGDRLGALKRGIDGP